MRKNLFLFLSFLTIGLGFTSCNKDDAPEEQEASLIGKWEYTKEGTVSANGVETLVDYEHTPNCGKDNIEITSNIVISNSYSLDISSQCELETISTNYSKNGNTLTITFSGQTYQATIKTLTSTELKIYDDDEVTVYKRI